MKLVTAWKSGRWGCGPWGWNYEGEKESAREHKITSQTNSNEVNCRLMNLNAANPGQVE